MKQHTKYIAVALLLMLVGTSTAYAQKVKIGLQSAVTYQALDQQDDDGALPEIANGFQNALGNLIGDFEVFDGGRAHVAMFISSKHHTEMWGYEGYFEMTKLPEWMNLGQFGEFYNEHLQLKAGQMTIDYGDGLLYRSINGNVYNNDLVGNPVPSPALTTLGVEGRVNFGPANLLLGLSNGTTKGDINEGHGTAIHGKAWVTPLDGKVRLAASFYTVDHSGNGTGYPNGGTKSYLYAFGDRAGSMYNIWNGPDGGQLSFGKGQDVFAYQFDGRVDLGRFVLYGAYGSFKDADTNGTNGEDAGDPEERWTYAMATARVNLTDWLYVAGRYSTAHCGTFNSEDADGRLNRFQVGAGFFLYKGVLVKAEYVKQTTDGFTDGYVNNRTNLSLNPGFDGFVLQTAVKL
ncbi:MAG: hypothetical protein ACE5G0_07765 [Rhodothermales bacterium]